MYINEGKESWDWSLPSKVQIDDPKKKQDFQASICGREAYIYRSAVNNVYVVFEREARELKITPHFCVSMRMPIVSLIYIIRTSLEQ